MKVQREVDVQFYPSLTTALDRVGVLRHTPAALSPGKRTSTHFTEGWLGLFRSRRVRKTSPPPRFEARTVEPVLSRYADCAIPAAVLELGDISRHFVFWLFTSAGVVTCPAGRFSRSLLRAVTCQQIVRHSVQAQLGVAPPKPSGYSTHLRCSTPNLTCCQLTTLACVKTQGPASELSSRRLLRWPTIRQFITVFTTACHTNQTCAMAPRTSSSRLLTPTLIFP